MSQKHPKANTPVPVTFTSAYKPLTTKLSLGILSLFLLISIALYIQGVGYKYVLDDTIVIAENNFVKKGLFGIGDILATDSFQGYFGEQKNLVQGARYRPLSIITFAIEHQFVGLSPVTSHLLNIIFYALTVFVSFLVLRRLFQEKVKSKKLFFNAAFLTSIIYLVHPIHVEAVANVKGRDEILSMLLSMYTFLLALKYIDTTKTNTLISIPIIFFLGLLAKENTITFLAIIPAGIWLFRSQNRKGLALISGILLASVIGYLILRYQVIGYFLGDEPSTDLMNNSFVGMNTVQRYGTILLTLLLYLKLCIFPHPLTHDYYPYHIPIMDFGDWQVWLSIAIHVILITLMIIYARRKKKLAFGFFFYISALSIVSNLVVSIGTFMNERFAFAASFGICLIMAYGIKQLSKKSGNNSTIVLTVLAAIILGLYSVKTFLRVPAWENELSLNKSAIKVSKNSARANSFMATALFNSYRQANTAEEKRRLLLEGLPLARRATEIHPTYYNGHIMRAGIASELYKADRNLDNLLEEFKAVMLVRPDIVFLEEFLTYINDSEDRNKMMAFYKDVCITNMIEKQQNYKWAIKYLGMAYKMDQNNPEIRRGMRKAYLGLGQKANADRFR